MRLLSKQDLAFRGDGDESDGNLQQLLCLQREKHPNLAHWLKRKEIVYKSSQIQNEMIKTLGLQVLRNIATDIHNSPFVTVKADETTHVSNREQFTVIIRRVSEDLQVDEEFIGLYQTSTTDAATLAGLNKAVFIRLNVSMKKLRGQCFDGASAMSGYRTGVAKRVNDSEPRVVFAYCYGHALNLAANDTLKQSKLMKDVLDTTREITKLIKYSPRRKGKFMKLKESSPASSTGIRVLCPTRWTVRADTLSSIISNYEALQSTWEEALAITKDTEAKARIQGVSAQMDMFQYLYGIMLSEMILRHADNLSRNLQNKSLSAEEGQQVAQMTVDTITSLQNDDAFDLMWEKVSRKARTLNVSEPQLPRKRKCLGGFARVRVKGTFMRPQKNTIDSAIMKHSISLSTVFNLDLISLATKYIILWRHS